MAKRNKHDKKKHKKFIAGDGTVISIGALRKQRKNVASPEYSNYHDGTKVHGRKLSDGFYPVEIASLQPMTPKSAMSGNEPDKPSAVVTDISSAPGADNADETAPSAPIAAVG